MFPFEANISGRLSSVIETRCAGRAFCNAPVRMCARRWRSMRQIASRAGAATSFSGLDFTEAKFDQLLEKGRPRQHAEDTEAVALVVSKAAIGRAAGAGTGLCGLTKRSPRWKPRMIDGGPGFERLVEAAALVETSGKTGWPGPGASHPRLRRRTFPSPLRGIVLGHDGGNARKTFAALSARPGLPRSGRRRRARTPAASVGKTAKAARWQSSARKHCWNCSTPLACWRLSQSRRRRQEQLDFADLIQISTMMLLDRSSAAWVLYKARQRALDHVLVDEERRIPRPSDGPVHSSKR